LLVDLLVVEVRFAVPDASLKVPQVWESDIVEVRFAVPDASLKVPQVWESASCLC